MQEMLLYTAEMKLEMAVSMAEKRKKVEDLLKQLALDVCRNVRIGSDMQRGISGMLLGLCQSLRGLTKFIQRMSHNMLLSSTCSKALSQAGGDEICSGMCMSGQREWHFLAQVGRQSAAT